MTQPMTEAPPTFNPDNYEWAKDLATALKDLEKKIPRIDKRWRYYDGEHPRVWITDTMREMLDDQLVNDMADNWIKTAVNAPLIRLKVTGWTNPDDNEIAVKAADLLFTDNDLDLDQTDLYRHQRIAGEAFLFAWKDESKESLFDISLNDARNVYWPDDAHRVDPRVVVKVWIDEDAENPVWRATCFYKFEVVRLIGPRVNADKALPQARYFEVDDEEPGGPHGFDKVPVIRYAMQRKCESIVQDLMSIQDKINKLSANHMVAAEFNAYRRLAILTQQKVDDDTLRARPDRAWILDPGTTEDGAAPTSIWEGEATELTNYDGAIDRLIEKLFTKASMPGHMQVKNDRAVPSGAAYEADEGPFTEMIEDMAEQMGASHSDLMALCLEGVEVNPQWRNPHVKSDKDEMDTVKVAVDAGMPLKLALKYYAGWGQDQLDELDNQPMSPADLRNVAMANALTGGMDVPQQEGAPDAGINVGKNGDPSGGVGAGNNAGSGGRTTPPRA